MILSLTINNYKAINTPLTLSLEGESHTKRLEDNMYISEGGFSSLKVVGIFGPNNVGKSCLLECLSLLKLILSGHSIFIPLDLFSIEKKVTTLGVTFLYNERVYSYICTLDPSSDPKLGESTFIYEKLSYIEKGSEKRNKESVIFLFDPARDKYIFKGESKVSAMLKLVSHTKSLLFSLNRDSFKEVSIYQDICLAFSESIEVLKGDYIPLSKTIEIIKENKKEAELLRALIRAADLGINDFGYSEGDIDLSSVAKSPLGEERVTPSEEVTHLYTTKMGDASSKRVPFFSTDSTGTRKVIALLGYIVDALSHDKVIAIDELGNSLHIGISTAIISMFNSELNHKGQLIFTSHDTSLIETSLLFRKDQIWFLSREKGKEYLYSLSDFNASSDKARPSSNNALKYRLGEYGAVPRVNLYSALMDLEALRPDSIQNREEDSEDE